MDNQTNVDVAPDPKPRPARRLEYDDARPTGISRRQMSVFLLLLFINTLLFAAFICLPTASPILKQMWTDWQATRTEGREQSKRRADINACLTFNIPPGQVVYAETPADIANLLGRVGGARVISERPQDNTGGLFGRPDLAATQRLLPDSGWREPAAFARAGPLNTFQDLLRSNGRRRISEYQDDTLVFLHGVKTPGGNPRLVWVSVDVEQSLVEPQANKANGAERPKPPHVLQTTRRLNAHVFDPDDLDKTTLTTIAFIEPPDARSRIQFYDGDDYQLRVKPWEPRGLWRIFAGQSDPTDPTHFTIPYDIDGKPGVIDGRLTDGDRLMLTPRAGRLDRWWSGTSYTWDLTATSTTQPTK